MLGAMGRCARLMPTSILGIVALAIAALAPAAPAGAAPPGDVGGFWALSPIGHGETISTPEATAYLATGDPPASFEAERGLFEALRTAAPGVSTAELDRFYKPAPIELTPAEVVSTSAPRPGVTISRDRFNVPFVKGRTRADVMWGAGWTAAADRLFFIDALRHQAQGRLTELIGPGPDGEVVETDVEQLSVTDYRRNDLQAMIDRTAASGPGGAQAIADLGDYVDGINAYIARARTDLSLQPAEYALLGKPMEDFEMTDAASIIALINGYFGRGGGVELDDAAVYRAAKRRFGARRSKRVIADFRSLNDPEAPVTTTRRFPFDDPGRIRRRSIASPDGGSLVPAQVVRAASSTAASRTSDASAELGGIDALRRLGGLPLSGIASNAIAIPAADSATGRPLLAGQPQVDFFVPPILLEQSLDGPGIHVRGVAIPGAAPYAVMGHGSRMAWTTTTAQGDNTDTFAERLCEPGGSKPTKKSTHYSYRGRCIPLEQHDDAISWSPGPADLAANPDAQPYSATYHTERSVHGPIIARGKVGGRPVAYARARSSYQHEVDLLPAFERLNGGLSRTRAVQKALAGVTGSYNWIFANQRHVGYVQSGLYPRRAKGTSTDLPSWGTGRWDWKGFDPASYDAASLPYRRLPKDVDPKRGYLLSWNNKQARGWRASDFDWEYGSVHRSQRLERRVRNALEGDRKLDLGELAGITGDAGTVDVRGQEVTPLMLRALGKPGKGEAGTAIRALRQWVRGGAHRIDRDGDGVYEDSLAVALMDRWWDPAVRGIFEPALGTRLIGRIARINPIDYLPVDGPDTWFYGWMSYVSKDLRTVLGDEVKGRYSREYCGGGRLARCRQVLRRSLRSAIVKVKADYGSLEAARVPSTCPVSVPKGCDQLEFIPAGVVELAPTPWQDRGSFQQMVEVGARHGG